MNALPTTNAQSSGTAACNGSSVILSANASSGTNPYTYAWSTGATPANNSTPTTNILANTTYTVTVTDNNNCTATSSVAVNMNALPTANAQSSGTAACNGSSVTLSANALSGTNPYTYAWSTGTTPTNNSMPTANILANTTYTVTVTDNNNCTATSSIAVNMNALPTANAQSSGTAACNGSSVTLSANASLGTNPYTYAWSTGATPTNNSTPTANILTNTTYTVTVTDNNNCTATSSVAVNMNALPNVTAGGGAICIGASQNITVGGADTYVWSDSLGSGDMKSVNPTISTTYSVTGTDVNNCSNTANAIVIINPLPTVTASGGTICVGESQNITAGGASTYAWSAGLGSGNSKLVNPTTSTTYTVTGTSDKNCSNTDEAIVTVNPLPTGDFSAQPLESVVNSEIVFSSDQITNVSIWDWQFGDGESSSDANTTKHSYKDAGQYNVILTLTSSQGCKTTYSKYSYITIKDLTKIWVPTAFTPNGDGQNDVLYVLGEFKSIHMEIYNKWGVLVFKTDSQSQGWDGKSNGIEQPEGIYSYLIRAINFSDKEVLEQGVISLLR